MTRTLDILVLQPDFSRYHAAYYQHQFTEALGRAHRIFRYGPKLENYDPRHTINDVLKLCPFRPDLICFGAGWEIETMDNPEFDPHPAINVAGLDVPSVMILNKEYKKLDRKLQFIRDNNLRLVFSVHHNYNQWAEQTGVPFVQFPFAVDERLFRDYGEKKLYALGFSGALHAQWTDLRVKVKNHLFLKWRLKAPRYWRTKLFWSEGRGWLDSRLPRGQDYGRLINRSRMWLATPSAVDIVGTRFFEIMATRTLLFCNRTPVYGELFKDKVHCVMFEPDLTDFDDKLFYYIEHDDERQNIVDTGYAHVLENHTWAARIRQFTEAVDAIL